MGYVLRFFLQIVRDVIDFSWALRIKKTQHVLVYLHFMCVLFFLKNIFPIFCTIFLITYVNFFDC